MKAGQMLGQIDRAAELPTLPRILLEVDRLLSDPGVSARRLGQLIEKDPAMTAKLLRLANSAFYGGSAPVSDIYSAMVMMGFTSVRSAVLSISVVRAFKKLRELEGMRITDFWRHAAAVAVGCRHIARQTRSADPDQAFVAGLLHDIGKLLLAQMFPELFAAVWSCMQQNGIPFYEAEGRTVPVDHAALGARLAERWKLPEELAGSIRRHHRVGADPTPLTAVVALADGLVNAGGEALDPATVAGSLRPWAEGLKDGFSELEEAVAEGTAFILDLQ
jgi:putative nucleotidyltransferase with HDIG domain